MSNDQSNAYDYSRPASAYSNGASAPGTSNGTAATHDNASGHWPSRYQYDPAGSNYGQSADTYAPPGSAAAHSHHNAQDNDHDESLPSLSRALGPMHSMASKTASPDPYSAHHSAANSNNISRANSAHASPTTVPGGLPTHRQAEQVGFHYPQYSGATTPQQVIAGSHLGYSATHTPELSSMHQTATPDAYAFQRSLYDQNGTAERNFAAQWPNWPHAAQANAYGSPQTVAQPVLLPGGQGLPTPDQSGATSRPPGSQNGVAPQQPQQPHVYSFVSLPGATQQKRPRRRYDEIERLYKCGYQGCEKAYGTLNHLNAHVSMQGHGAKRTPDEFKEIRKAWRQRKKEEEAKKRENAIAYNSPSAPGYAQTGAAAAVSHLSGMQQHGGMVNGNTFANPYAYPANAYATHYAQPVGVPSLYSTQHQAYGAPYATHPAVAQPVKHDDERTHGDDAR
ncbi:hypothetical protein G7K_1192-t2 [Saitoella complicata NRRL Y-17804]|uniref:C2H2-type domain-containing protein n=2 Tax=Saitoella complicata (strain BCRC 22490 / CBS 7301 / JCM 7358 / NBRC 10748 / NRRL Y-17804) TaxID=698492 RepID=A0A0E9NB00_SAICN|nr:hypothetical protein G7K_1192-t2 [Saitoella complicata NRRL Y-17804]